LKYSSPKTLTLLVLLFLLFKVFETDKDRQTDRQVDGWMDGWIDNIPMFQYFKFIKKLLLVVHIALVWWTW